MSEFKNKVVLITGGSSGIGFETARMFCQAGATVVFSGRDLDKGIAAEKKLMAIRDQGTAKFFCSDASCAADVKALVQSTVDEFGCLDIAFNNAGFGGEISPLHLQNEENWNRVVDANLKGVWFSMKYQLQQFLKQEPSSHYNIVNMSSVWGVGASDFGVSPYIASKHGVIGLTEAAALEYAKYQIRVNAVCPGWVLTEKKLATLSEQEQRQVGASYPLNRLAKMSEVASAVLWLADSSASFVTGHSLTIDGGISVKC